MALQQGVAMHLSSPSPATATETVVMPSGASVTLSLPVSYSNSVIPGGDGQSNDTIKGEGGKESNDNGSISLSGFLRRQVILNLSFN